ncbi:MAG: hypothetical protein ABFS34_01350 [Gemmatimonadota bacterium]
MDAAAALAADPAAAGYRLASSYGDLPGEELTLVAGLEVLPSGNVVVLDTGGGRFMVLDAGLRPVSSIGRLGQGPGELEFVPWARFGRAPDLLAADDTLLYVANGAAAVSLFTHDGAFRRNLLWRLSAASGVDANRSLRQLVGLSADGIAVRERRLGPEGVAERLAVLSWEALERRTASGRDPLLASEWVSRPIVPGPNGAPGTFSPPCEAGPLWFADGATVVVSDGLDSAIGGVGGAVRTTDLPDPDAICAAGSDIKRRAEALIGVENLPSVRRRLRWTAIALDPAGSLWLREWRPPGESGPVAVIVRRDGSVARVRLPDFPWAFTPDGGFVAVHEDTETGVQSIRLYAAEPGADGG